MVPFLLQRVTVNTQHLDLLPLFCLSLSELWLPNSTCCLHSSFHIQFPHLFKFCQAYPCSAFGGIFKCNMQKATIWRTVLATVRSVEKIYPINIKIVVILHTVNTNAWFLMDALLFSSWDKLSQALKGAPFLNFSYFLLLSCCLCWVYTRPIDLSAHSRPLFNSLHTVFFLYNLHLLFPKGVSCLWNHDRLLFYCNPR